MIQIRLEQPEDLAHIHLVNQQAFTQEAEALLVDKLRARGKAVFSLVAFAGPRLVGHVLFSPVHHASHPEAIHALGLGPMAVLPEFQKRGIGTLLVEAGLAECRKAQYDFVVVLGHPEYYPRFGFVPASRYGIKCEYPVPDEVFMLIELRAGALQGRHGIVKYEPEFDEV